jgi:hypothetical protein
VEVGVFRGHMSEHLLVMLPGLVLHMVDRWTTTDGQPPHRLSQGDLLKETRLRTAPFGPRARIVQADSVHAATTFRDASLDFVFLDADHGYEAVRADIAAWLPKVKPGGLLSGHDYATRQDRTWGVIQAVDEAAVAHGWDLGLGQNATWFVRLP